MLPLTENESKLAAEAVVDLKALGLLLRALFVLLVKDSDAPRNHLGLYTERWAGRIEGGGGGGGGVQQANGPWW